MGPKPSRKNFAGLASAYLLGDRLQIDLPAIADMYRAGAGIAKISAKFGISKRYDVSEKVARTAVLRALSGNDCDWENIPRYSGLIEREEFDRLARSHKYGSTLVYRNWHLLDVLKEKGLKWAEVIENTNICRSSLGKCSRVTGSLLPENVKKLCDFLGVDEEEIFPENLKVISVEIREEARRVGWNFESLDDVPEEHLVATRELTGGLANILMRECRELLLGVLSPTERKVIERKYGFLGVALSSKETAEDLEFSLGWVDSLESKALRRLSASFSSEDFEELLREIS